MAEYAKTDAFRGATFRQVDFTGATFRECELIDVTIVASDVANLRVSGHAGELGRVVINDVDVTGYVMAELDRRHPELVQVRAVKTADDIREMWDVIERLWAETAARAERLPEDARHEGVGIEWSFVQTLRHLVFATDVWVERMVGGRPLAFHRLGLPPGGYPAEGARDLGLDVDADPSYAEALDLHRDAMRRMRECIATITDDELAETRTQSPAPVWEEMTVSVGGCLRVVLEEHCQHRRFAERDLALLEAARA